MNKRLVIGIIIIILIFGGMILLNSTKKNAPQNTAPTIQSQSASPSVSIMNKATTDNTQQTITLTQDGFSPRSLTIKAGTKVTWVNKSGNTATVNSNPHPIHTDYPPLNLGQFANGMTLELTFSKIGTYGYHNHYDSSQNGTIIVQ